MSDSYRISGERRPIAGIPYRYSLKIPAHSFRWEMRDGLRIIPSNQTGVFTFLNPSLGKAFTIYVYYKEKPDSLVEQSEYITVKPLPGPSEINLVAWKDANFKEIKDTMKYLDDIYLFIQTTNIPPGDDLAVKLWEKESKLFDDRAPGGRLTTTVNEAGVAWLKVSAHLLKEYAKKLNEEDLFDDKIHKYYAEISYFGHEVPPEKQLFYTMPGQPSPEVKPKITIIKKSDVLKMENMADKTLKPGNGIKPVIVDIEKPPVQEKNPVQVKINVYFDGTMGNKWNVEAREDPEKYYETEDKDGNIKMRKGEDILKDYSKDPKDSTSSYNQVYTSITDLYNLDKSNAKEKEVKIYIEGVGSQKYGEDIARGYALGWDWGGTGIKAKIEKAMGEILRGVNKIVDSNQQCVTEAKVCPFGFSRGATTARNFVSKKEQIALNALTATKNVRFLFVGIFDTVSSIKDMRDDVKSLDLKIGGRAEKVLHLTAGNEYRGNFSLTDISSSMEAGVGYELMLPGDHSDIGGGHKDNITERVEDNHSFVDKLISEGWHREEDRRLKIIEVPIETYPYYMTYEQSVVTRTIRNEYRYIPLSIMIYFANKDGKITFNENVQKRSCSVKSEDLIPVKDTVYAFAVANDGSHSRSATHLLTGQQLKDIRHKYLHLSAVREGGHSGASALIAYQGRYDKAGNPNREIIPG